MKLKSILKSLLLLLIYTPLGAQQQVPDLDFEVSIDNPRYTDNETALIGIDAAHHNLHQLDGGFAPFARLMEADGYELGSVSTFNKERFSQFNILVIANPLHASNVGNWKQPIAAAFTEEEIEQVEQWVAQGGSLLLIADHMPYGGAASTLAQRFGFEYADGFAMAKEQVWPPDSYSKKAGTLHETSITQNIDSLAGFTGSALKAPQDATIVAHFPNSHQILLPEVAWQFEKNTTTQTVDGFVMGAYKQHGKGKVACFTEAAMFTAQLVQGKYRVGFNSPMAPQNQQFVLNVIHWLDSGKTKVRSSKEDKAREIVHELLSQQAEAYKANEMEKVASFYSQDGIIYEPTGREIRGMADIIDYWKKLKGNAVDWKTQILEVEAIGEQILAVCRFEISFKRRDEVLIARSKALLTLKKEEGKYRIFRDFYAPLRQ